MNTTIDQAQNYKPQHFDISWNTHIHIRILMMIRTFTTAATVPAGFEVSGIWKSA
jgi:hypothetical protein